MHSRLVSHFETPLRPRHCPVNIVCRYRWCNFSKVSILTCLTANTATVCNTATACNTMQQPATHFNSLQPTATLYFYCCRCSNSSKVSSIVIASSAAYCNKLQQTATNCTKLHYTATHSIPTWKNWQQQRTSPQTSPTVPPAFSPCPPPL